MKNVAVTIHESIFDAMHHATSGFMVVSTAIAIRTVRKSKAKK